MYLERSRDGLSGDASAECVNDRRAFGDNVAPAAADRSGGSDVARRERRVSQSHGQDVEDALSELPTLGRRVVVISCCGCQTRFSLLGNLLAAFRGGGLSVVASLLLFFIVTVAVAMGTLHDVRSVSRLYKYTPVHALKWRLCVFVLLLTKKVDLFDCSRNKSVFKLLQKRKRRRKRKRAGNTMREDLRFRVRVLEQKQKNF